MDRIEKSIFFGLCVLAGVLSVLLIGGHKSLFSANRETLEPFLPERVVKVQIIMAEKDWEWIRTNARAEQYVRADFWFDGHRYPNVAVRPKGNSSLMSVASSGSPRLSLKVDFNFFNSAQSFRGLKKLSLNNGFSDPTYIREIVSYEVFKEMKLPTPRAAFVDLYVNETHLGVYTQVEPIDKAFLERHFANPNGNLYKPEVGAATLNWTEADVKKKLESNPPSQRQEQNKNLALNIGGSRLGDLLRLMDRERNGVTSENAGQNMGFPGGGFPGGPGPGGFGGGGMPPMPMPGPGEGFPPDAAQFRNDGNRSVRPGAVFGGEISAGEGFVNRPPRDTNNVIAGAGGPFPQGMDGRMIPARGLVGGPTDPNQPAGFRGPRMDRGGQGDRGFRPGGFGGGPGGPGGFGRGGNLLENMGLKTNENYQDHSALLHFLNVLNNTPDETFAAEIEKVLDVDQVLRYLAVSSMLVHLDNYTGMGHNYYLYERNGYFTILPWDLNMSFGTFGGGGNAADFYIDEPVTGGMDSRPLVKRLLAYPPYLERYHQYHEEMLAGCFAEGVLEARIDAWANLIRPYVEKDELKFFTMEQFEKGLNEGSSGMGGGMGMRRPGEMFNAANRGPEMGMPPGMGMPPQMPGNTGPAVEQAVAGGQKNRQLRPSQQNQQMQQGRQGRAMGGPGGGPGGGGMGMNAPGLKSFLAKRRISVRKQLDGEIPSKPTTEQRQQNNQWPGMPGPGGMP